MHRRRFLQGALAAQSLAAPMIGSFVSPAGAQAYPSRNVTIIVAFPPGGQADLAARPVAQALERILGKSVIVDNRSGAGGMVGNAFAARAEPDGHTLLMALSSMTFLPEAERLYDRKPSYELDQFVPIARVLADPGVLCVRADAPWKTLGDLVSDAKARPGQISFSSSGNYGAAHVPFEMFQQAAGIKLLHVPYRGGAALVNGLAAGDTALGVTTLTSVKGLVDDGKINVVAQLNRERPAFLKEWPTMTDAGLNVDAGLTVGVYVPANTPAAIVSRVDAEVLKILKDEGLRKRFNELGMEVSPVSGPALAERIRSEAARYKQIIAQTGVKLN